jgi:hypothetical protein
MKSKADRQQTMLIAASLFIFTLLSRIPFRSQILYHWDSVNFAYAMREFSVAKEQPQPPGYILYVGLCRLIDSLFGDAQTTMVAISIAASALAVVALFFLGRSMFDKRVGLAAALFLAVSPLFWFYGEIALPHALDAFLVILSVWWLYEVMQGDYRYLYPAVAVVAIAGGVRQQTLVFLTPLLLFALRRVGWKRFLIAGMLGVVICLAWFVPLMAQSDGLSNYLRVVGAFSRRFQSSTSVFLGGGWWGVRRNVLKLAMYTIFAWSIMLAPAIVYAAYRFGKREWPRRREESIFLLLWVAPALVFYAIVHMGQQGLVFVFLPALLIVSAVGLVRLLGAQPYWLTAALAAVLVVNVVVFLLAPEYPLGSDTPRLLTRATLANSDRYYQDRFEVIEEYFTPESAAILAANWHHVEYYLPEYTRLSFSAASKWEKWEDNPLGGSQEMIVTPVGLGLQPNHRGHAAIIVFDPIIMDFNETPQFVHAVSLQHGGRMNHFVLTGEQAFYFGPRAFGIEGN